MTWATRTKAISVGDTVAFSAAWLRSTGQYTGAMPAARGTVIRLIELGQTTLCDIDWQDHEIPPRVNIANLSRVTERGGIIGAMSNIFVFGSNLAGRHGKGAALFARQNHGAIYGQGIGLQGNSYAIPTKDEKIMTLPLDTIEKHVAEFKRFAAEHPEMTFQVTAIGCGLAGYTPAQIAPMFAGSPTNCLLPDEFKAVLDLPTNQTPSR